MCCDISFHYRTSILTHIVQEKQSRRIHENILVSAWRLLRLPNDEKAVVGKYKTIQALNYDGNQM